MKCKLRLVPLKRLHIFLSAFFSEWTATEKELRENPAGKVIYYQDAEPNPSLRGKGPYLNAVYTGGGGGGG